MVFKPAEIVGPTRADVDRALMEAPGPLMWEGEIPSSMLTITCINFPQPNLDDHPSFVNIWTMGVSAQQCTRCGTIVQGLDGIISHRCPTTDANTPNLPPETSTDNKGE